MKHRADDGDDHQKQHCSPRTSGKEGQNALNTTTQQQQSSLLKWSDKQSHILTGGGVSSRWYRSPRFPFSEEELPHFHKARGDTHDAFAAWLRQGTDCAAEIAGAWRRPLFVGGWTHSDDVSQDGETTFNLQARSLFIDMRIPKEGTALLGHHQGFDTMTDLELRLFARRHAFAGYTRVESSYSPSGSRSGGDARHQGAPAYSRVPASKEDSVSVSDRDMSVRGESGGGEGGGGTGGGDNTGSGENYPARLVATRHHAIDWNYVGRPRPRPNKWRVEMGPGGDTWKEWGFAKDAFDQHVYMERWQRLPEGGGASFAMRRRAVTFPSCVPDAILVVCGDHFGLIVDRSPELLMKRPAGGDSEGLVGMVDDAIARGDRPKAVEFLSLEASHGRVSAREGRLPWTVDCSLHPWLQERRPLQGMLITIAPDNQSARWSRENMTPSTAHEGDRRSPSAATKTTVGAGEGYRKAGLAGEGTGHRGWCHGGRWKGLPLDGVWDVLENTWPKTIPHSLQALFRGSGARVVRGESDDGPAGVGGRTGAYARAKL